MRLPRVGSVAAAIAHRKALASTFEVEGLMTWFRVQISSLMFIWHYLCFV